MIQRLLPVGIMAGAVIGAGIFSLPYVFVQVGILNGLLFLAIATVVVTLVHLFYADLILRTSGTHNFVGYSRIYLGKVGGFFAVFMSVLQMILVLVIYLILSQSFINLILGGTSLVSLFIFWIIGSLAIFLTLRRLALVESLIIAGVIAIIAFVFIVALPDLASVSLGSVSPSVNGFLLVIGPILFALGGRAAVVESVKYARKPKNVKWGIVWGTVVPAIVYAVFVLAVVALSYSAGLGQAGVSEDAVSGLINNIHPILLVLIGILGLLSILSSYIAIGFDVNNILAVDLRWPFLLRFITIALVPLGLYLYGFQDFIQLVSFSGGVLGALAVIFMTLMWHRAATKAKTKGPILLKEIPFAVIVLIILLFGLVLIQQVYVHVPALF